jgi:protease-4
MRRFIVGLLSTIGFFTLLSLAGAVVFVTSTPFTAATARLVVLSLDLRKSGRGHIDQPAGRRPVAQQARHHRDAAAAVASRRRSAGRRHVSRDRRRVWGRPRPGNARARASAQGQVRAFAETLAPAATASPTTISPPRPAGSAAAERRLRRDRNCRRDAIFRSGLDKLGVRVEGGKRWEYKSAPDIFTESGFTPPARQNLQQLVDSLYGQFIHDVAGDRHIAPAKLRQLVDSAPFEAERARSEGLIDRIGYRADAMDGVWQRAGGTRDIVTLAEYGNDNRKPKPDAGVVALVRVSGTIVSGSVDGNLLDDDALATAEDVVDTLDQAARAKEVRAIVLRIDSPGGTYPAADAMADGVARARAAGKPVIVSMGDVAASGGYLAAI